VRPDQVAATNFPASAVPWPDAARWSHRELRAYLDAAANPAIQALPTRREPWTVTDLSAHLAATFRRFADQLERARAGNLGAPFGSGELTSENLRAVRDFRGEPRSELAMRADRFLTSIDAVDEVIGHQFGPIPVGLQVMFGLVELTIHHDDLAHATGGSYRPSSAVAAAMAGTYHAIFGLPSGSDPWAFLLRATGR
jgi:uncharacterized protein (TIGR03083 family)